MAQDHESMHNLCYLDICYQTSFLVYIYLLLYFKYILQTFDHGLQSLFYKYIFTLSSFHQSHYAILENSWTCCKTTWACCKFFIMETSSPCIPSNMSNLDHQAPNSTVKLNNVSKGAPQTNHQQDWVEGEMAEQESTARQSKAARTVQENGGSGC